VDDDDGGSSRSDLGKGEDDGGGFGSAHRARPGEARVGPPAETAREVRVCGGGARDDEEQWRRGGSRRKTRDDGGGKRGGSI